MADAKLNIIINAKDKASGPIGGVTKSLGSLGKLAGAAVATGLAATAAGILAVGAGLAKMAIDAAPIEGIKMAFEGLTSSVEGGAQAMLAAMKEQSAGMVSNTDLMKTYNLGAQLVSDTFAQTLPDAMGYLSKVSAATGEDMSFMLDSLVRGVGRLSPMILDNLGIQVDLTEAYQDYADELGITVSEMSKTEQQTALMNQVMEKLKENTAAMPEVIGTANQQWEETKVRFQDLKDELGMELLPAFSDLLEYFADLADEYMPVFVDFFKDDLVPIIEKGVEWVGNFLDKLGELKSIDDFIPQSVKDGIQFVVDKFNHIKDQLSGPIMEFFESIRSFWAEHGPGITETLSNLFKTFIELASDIIDTILPEIIDSFESWARWLDENGPLIEDSIEDISEVIGGLGKASVEAFEMTTPLWEDLDTNLQNTATSLMQIGQGDWASAWETIKENIKINVETAVEWYDKFLEKAGELLGFDWEGVKEKVGTFIDTVNQPWEDSITQWMEWAEVVQQAVSDAVSAAEEVIPEWVQAGKDMVEGIKQGITDAWGALKEMLANKLRGLISWAKKVLGAGSPSKEFMAIGAAIVDGLREGVESMWDRLVERVRNKFRSLIDFSRSFLGIDSPSSVFMEIGGEIVEGVRVGIGHAFPEIITEIIHWFDGLIQAIDDKFDDIADLAYEMQRELLKVAGVIGSIGFGAAKYTMGPLEDEIDTITDQMEGLRDSIASFEMLQPAAIDELLLRGSLMEFQNYLLAFADLSASERSSILAFAQSYMYLQQQRYDLEARLTAEQEKLLALEQQRADLAFLQQQLKLLELIEEYNLPKRVAEGLRLGLDDPGLVLESMTEAMQALIEAAKTQLGIGSPSQVFREIGENMMQGMAMGITGLSHLPAAAVAGASNATTHQWNLTINESGRVNDPVRSFAYMRALAGV